MGDDSKTIMTTQTLVQCPEQFNFSTPAEWPKWIRRFDRYKSASGLAAKDEVEQINTLIYLMGDQAEDIFLTFTFATAGEEKKYAPVVKKFEKHFIVRRNTIYERAKFNARVQLDGEPAEQFITSLYGLVEYCEYSSLKEEMIRDRIVVGVRDRKLSEKLQLDNNLTLAKAVEIVRQHEDV